MRRSASSSSYGDYASWDERHRDFARESGAFNLWVGLMCAQTALWALALAWLLPVVRRLRREYGDQNRSERFGSTAVILLLILGLAVGGPLHSRWPDYVQNHTVKIAFLTLVGALVGLVAAQGVWLVHGGLKRLGGGDLRDDSAVPTFLSLGADLNRFLSILGAILGLIVLSASAQRQTVLDFAPATNFPYQGVLLYGLFFSILVAAVYIPAHLTLASAGSRDLRSGVPRDAAHGARVGGAHREPREARRGPPPRRRLGRPVQGGCRDPDPACRQPRRAAPEIAQALPDGDRPFRRMPL